MRLALATACLLIAADLSSAATAIRHRHPYRREWKHKTFGKNALLSTVGGAGMSHALNHPSEWGRGWDGFGKRVGNALGKHVIKTSVEFGVAGLRHEDLRYYPSRKRGFGPRLKHALVSTVVTRKTTNGKKTVAAGRISGNVASGVISRAWQPAAMHTAASAAGSAGIGLGADAAANVVREFWPEIRHPKNRQHRRRL